MKIHLVSDVHLEFGKMKYTPPECDVVIVAGDTAPGVQGLVWAKKTYGDIPVVAIAGNHEFYNRRILSKHYADLKKKAEELGIFFLQNESVVIDGVKFSGATLWTDFTLIGNQPLAMVRAAMEMNDYNQILQAPKETLKPVTILNEHKASMEFLTNDLSEDFEGPVVVVTHHAPSELSVGPNFKGDDSNCFYATNLERFIEIMEPTVWVHGHMHSSSDYMVGTTRVVTNPRGYIGYSAGYNHDFDDKFIFEV